MAIEIEHKFLLADPTWKQLVIKSVIFKQGYLNSNSNSSIRVRISDSQAWLNIKTAIIGNQRHEYEYEIPLADANEILALLCNKPIIEKTRHYVPINEHLWEIDEFHGENEGLIIAEIELEQQITEFHRPEWLGAEVTHDLRYYNNNLAHTPYSKW